MKKQKCTTCGTERKLISCIVNNGARVWLCVECLSEMKRDKEARK